MLHNIKRDLHGKRVLARDDKIGFVADAYFDDARWVVRYLVVDTGDWLPGRKVLISPASIALGQPERDAVRLELSTQEVRDSPGADSDLPVSRQFEQAHAQYYGYPFYWDGPYLWGSVQQPVGEAPPVTATPGGSEARVSELKSAEQRARESTLRSSKEVTGYRVAASDGPIGHVDDFVFDNDHWGITKLVVDTRDWLPGGQVMVTIDAVEHIDWITREVRLNATREAVKRAPKAP